MNFINCSCGGINLNCIKCDGKGFYDVDIENKTYNLAIINEPSKVKEYNKENVIADFKSFSEKIELISIKQEYILTKLSQYKGYYRNSKVDKKKINNLLDDINQLEIKKQLFHTFLKGIVDDGVYFNIKLTSTFKHPFCLKEIKFKTLSEAQKFKKNGNKF